MHRQLALAMAITAATGCATGIILTERGARVQEVATADIPTGCQMLGDVSIGIPPDAARPRTEEQLVTLMRNKAAEIGGTHVLVESREPRTEAGREHFVGRGVAYRCPEATPSPSE